MALQILISQNASNRYIEEFTERCYMKLRKDAINITNQIFGDLTAIKPVKNGKYRGIKWLCKCICGQETIAFGGHLRAGMRISCGCRSQKYIEHTGYKRLFANYKRKARLRNLDFNLPFDVFCKLIKGNCTYCGQSPNQELKRLKTKKLQIQYIGIDRYDHTKGYTIDNCVSCCRYCNLSKADLSIAQWKEHLERIYKWHLIGF